MTVIKSGVAVKETAPGGAEFSISATLVKPADVRAKEWQDKSDGWQVAVTCSAGGRMMLDYRTGIGHRIVLDGMKRSRLSARVTVWEWNNSHPVHPSARSVLYCIGSDWQTAEEMPRGDAEAMDYLQSEFGHDGKASGLLHLVRALRKIHDDVARMLQGSGMAPAEFAAWAYGLES
jgi:hypothetical protein